MTRRTLPALAALGLLLALAPGCMHPISKELRERATENLTFPMVCQNPAAHKGAIVVWGGSIIQTINRKDGTEILVLEAPLDSEGEPIDARSTRGRFIARTPEFLDPEVYKRGLRITLGGEVAGSESRPLGQIRYVYPAVAIQELYLWPEMPVVRYRTHGWYGPGFGWGLGWRWNHWDYSDGWGPPYWGPYWGP